MIYLIGVLLIIMIIVISKLTSQNHFLIKDLESLLNANTNSRMQLLHKKGFKLDENYKETKEGDNRDYHYYLDNFNSNYVIEFPRSTKVQAPVKLTT